MVNVENLIKLKLRANKLTQKWLMAQLADKGVVTDKTELSSVLNRHRYGKKAEIIVAESLLILERYEQQLPFKT